MEQQKTPRAASFLLVMSWIYIIFAIGMIGFAIFQLTNSEIQLTFRIATESVFLIIGGALGILAGIFGLVSKNLKRCRLIGLMLLAIAAVPLIINLIAGDTFNLYWKNLAAIILPFLYLLAALFKRSVKKPAITPTPSNQPTAEQLSQYAAAPKPEPEPQPQTTEEEVKPEPEQPQS